MPLLSVRAAHQAMTHYRKAPTLIMIAVIGIMQTHLLGQSPAPTPKPNLEPATLKTRTDPNVPAAEPIIGSTPDPIQEHTLQAGRILRVALDRPLLKLSKLRPGSELDGQVDRPVFLRDKAVIPQGSKVHLVVDHTVKQVLSTKPARGILDRVERVRSLRFRAPSTYQVFLKPVIFSLPDGTKADLQVSFIRGGEMIALHPKGNDLKLGDSSATGPAVQGTKDKVAEVKDAKKNAEATWKKYRHPTVTLRLDQPAVFPSPADNIQAAALQPVAGSVTIPAGVTARLLLLSDLNSSESALGESFQARLQEPIQQEGRTLLPEGCIFVGHIARVTAPRRLSRAGSMQLVFDSIQTPNGGTQKIVASLSGVETDKQQPTKMDAEGGLKGGSQSKKQAIAAAAVAIVVGHLVEEAVSSPIETAASAAAGSALGPIIGVGTGVVFYLAGRGKDAELTKYTDLEITFGRPLILPASGVGETVGPAGTTSAAKQ